MNKINHILLSSTILAGLSSCASEAPFWEKGAEGEGKILTSSLTVKVKGDEKLVRAESATPDVDDFTVAFIDPAAPDHGVIKTYIYKNMPEVVTLPVGTYQVKAYYGGSYGADEATAAFDAPYYLGLSSNFKIESNKIIDDIQPIECKLSNVKVSINFDEELVNNMSADSFVEVTVGESSSLKFTKNTDKSGFFQAPESSSTLVARFSGVVEDEVTEETKLYHNVSAGTYYKITFKLHAIDPNEPGNITTGGNSDEPIKIDASVNLEDLTGSDGENIIPDEEIYLKDDRYPTENIEPEVPGPEEPGPDEPGNDDPVTGAGPDVTCVGADFGTDNKVAEMTECIVSVKSETGITKFTVDIDSPTLNAEELEGVGLAAHLDLVNPGELLDALQGLDFMKEDQSSLAGVTEADLSITQFLSLLPAVGPGISKFNIVVSDASGTTKKTLTLVVE